MSTAPPSAAPTAVCLVGFMGAGKTSVGRELARRLGWEFVDLDGRIQSAAGKTVQQIFAEEGEAGFRKREMAELARVLDELEELGPAVLALGGGTWIPEQARTAVHAHGAAVVFLDVSAEEAKRRCEKAKVARPLMKDIDALNKLLEERSPFYATADLKVTTEGRNVDEVTNEIMARLRLGSAQSKGEVTKEEA